LHYRQVRLSALLPQRPNPTKKRRDAKGARELLPGSFYFVARARGRRCFPSRLGSDYGRQPITPLSMVQTFADCECVAVPLQLGGGPRVFTITTVTFCDGLKP
jgi:hypothetical protein